MSGLRVVRRMATWYQCAMLLAVAAFFAWVIREGLRSTNPDLWRHVLIPPYGLWLYATLAALVNRRSVVVTPAYLELANGPIPLGVGRVRIPRADVAFSYYLPVITVGDDGDTIVLWHTMGIETRDGRSVPVFGTFDDADAARAAARRIAVAFGAAPDGSWIDARPLGTLRDDPDERRRIVLWVGLVAAAFVAGGVWEVASRA